MQTIQKRRERENRQINERLRTLMAAYKTLGSSFTGNLTVSPVHLRHARALEQTCLRTKPCCPMPTMTAPSPEAIQSASAAPATRWRPRCPTLFCWAPKNKCAWQRKRHRHGGRSPGANRGLGQQLAAVHPRGAVFGSHSADVTIPNQGPLRPSSSTAATGRRSGNAESPAVRQPCRWSR